jgi:hypothetical protein
LRRVEFWHGSGSLSLVDATYFWTLLSASVNLLHGWVLVLVRPAAVLEAVAGVLVGVPRCLHHAVKGQVLDDDDLAQAALRSPTAAKQGP